MTRPANRPSVSRIYSLGLLGLLTGFLIHAGCDGRGALTGARWNLGSSRVSLDAGAGWVLGNAVAGALPAAVPPSQRSPGRDESKAPRAAGSAAPARGVEDRTRRDFQGNTCLSSGCHAQLGETRWVHGPVAVGACAVCHEEAGKAEEHRFELVRSMDNLCVFCHPPGDRREHVHDPVAKSNCIGCHNPHGGTNKNFFGASSTAEVCAKCHDAQSFKFPHTPVDQGDCLGCHRAHDSEFVHLLIRKKEELCFVCHAKYDVQRNAPPEGQHVHQVVVDGGCESCHAAHGSNFPGMVASEIQPLCESCHEEVAQELLTARSAHKDLSGDKSCTGCHRPHVSEFEKLLRDSSGKLCFECHDRRIVRASGAKIPSIKAEIANARFVHQPVAEGACTGCHRAHSSTHPSLLSGSYPDDMYTEFSESAYELCFQCHDKRNIEEERTTLTGFRNGDRNLHFVHVRREKGRSCRVCHTAHASDIARQMRSSVPFGPGGWQLPINFQPTENGGSCASGCHKKYAYERTVAAAATQGEESPPR